MVGSRIKHGEGEAPFGDGVDDGIGEVAADEGAGVLDDEAVDDTELDAVGEKDWLAEPDGESERPETCAMSRHTRKRWRRRSENPLEAM